METIQQCLRMGGKHAEPGHIRMIMDCAEICQTSANFMLRGSDFQGYTCSVCSEACRICSQSCSEMAESYNHAHM